MKQICILGSTGSIGSQTLEVVRNNPEEFQIIGIVSVEGSPSCGYRLTCRGSWEGEIGSGEDMLERAGSLKMIEEPGVMMEILQSELNRRNMDISIISLEDAVNRLLRM